VRTGTERLDVELMDRVKNDAASEAARKEMTAALTDGKMTTKPGVKRGTRLATASR
jgi:hypothetical protein